MKKKILAFSLYINSIDLPSISNVFVKVNKVVVTILFVVKFTRKKNIHVYSFLAKVINTHTHTHFDTTFIDMEYPQI